MNRAERIRELRRSGTPLRKIAAEVGCDVSYCSQVCKAAGMGGAIIEQRLSESRVADYVSRSGFDYVGGYQSQKKPITVRCRQCGRTFERQFHIFRDVVNGTWQCGNECPLCRADKQRAERERKAKEAKAEQERDARIKAEQREMREADLISRQLEERLAIHVCKNCGESYCIESTGYNSTKYCSEKCMKRWAMRVKNDRRHKKIASRRHDADITLEKLFRRDEGICYLCFGKCDWNDVDADGNACDNYPSIDHVKPIAKGGTHTWDNIKLAHRRCNWEKSDAY